MKGKGFWFYSLSVKEVFRSSTSCLSKWGGCQANQSWAASSSAESLLVPRSPLKEWRRRAAAPGGFLQGFWRRVVRYSGGCYALLDLPDPHHTSSVVGGWDAFSQGRLVAIYVAIKHCSTAVFPAAFPKNCCRDTLILHTRIPGHLVLFLRGFEDSKRWDPVIWEKAWVSAFKL